MKPESEAWQRLQDTAADRLSAGFADRVLRAASGPTANAWRQLQDHAAARLRASFADRVLRAVRVEIPSLFDQLALSAATAGVCVLAVVSIHSFSVQRETQRNLAHWNQLAAQVDDFEQAR